jgi:hypothetical protein
MRRAASPIAVRAVAMRYAHLRRWNLPVLMARAERDGMTLPASNANRQQEQLKPLIGSGLADLPVADYGIAAISPCHAPVFALERSAASVRFSGCPAARLLFVQRYSRGYTPHDALTLVLSGS